MKDKDLYNILGISREASAEKINEAYSILGNRNKRKYYDLKSYKLCNESYSRGGSYGFQAYWPRRGPHNPFKCMGRGLGACFRHRGTGKGRGFSHNEEWKSVAEREVGLRYSIFFSTSSAISIVLISSSLPSSFIPSSIIVMQKGQPTATFETCCPTISSERSR